EATRLYYNAKARVAVAGDHPVKGAADSFRHRMNVTETELKPQSPVKSAIRDIVETLLLTLVIFLIVQSVVKNFKVEGSSMEPTLHDGEFLLVDKAVYWSLSPGLVGIVSPSA